MCNCPSCSWDGPCIPEKDEWIEDMVNRLYNLSDCKLIDLLNVPSDEFQDYTFLEKDWAIREFLEDHWDLNFGEKADALCEQRWDDYASEWEMQELYH